MSVCLTIEDYRVPIWSAPPSHQYFLEIIKDGSTISEIKLSEKPFFLIGKHPDMCDIVLQNPSISRKHAILQFRNDDFNAYLYDLESTHGTTVNHRKLPSRVYHKLNIFDTIMFGSSAKMYILRCPALEKQGNAEAEEDEEGTEFQKMIKKQYEGGLTKEQLKEKYLDMIQNDPYYKAAQGKGRQFQGAGHRQQEDGVNWGISNEYEVYAYRDQNDYALEPDLLRRLPGLDNNLLIKISEYEQKLQKYQELQGELRDLANKEQREFGLEEKSRSKKEGLEKRTVEMSEQMDKLQNYLKLTLFGEESVKSTYQINQDRKNQLRQKQIDTFQNDEFYDRTLQKKEELNLESIRQSQVGETTEDYWKIKNRLEELLLKRRELNKQLIDSATRTYQSNNMQEDDEYERYMNETEDKLKQQTREKLIAMITLNDEEIDIYKSKIEKIRPAESISNNIVFEKESDPIVKSTKVGDTLTRLQRIEEERQEVDEGDESIFKYYEKVAQQEVKVKKLYRQAELTRQLVATDDLQNPPTAETDDPGPTKRPKPFISRNAPRKHQQELFVDLTKKFD